MYPWRRILVPTDFSTASSWAFDDAVRLAGPTSAEVVVLHVRMTRASSPGELRFPADAALYEYAEQTELEKLRALARHANASVVARLLVRTAPDPGSEICRTAVEEDADLIVMATHARHHVAHLLLGSTTLDVLTNAHVPLLAVRYGIHLENGVRRILVPVHGKQESDASLRLAAKIATWNTGEVELATVCRPADCPAAEQLLAEKAAAILPGVRFTTTVLTGDNIDREMMRHLERSGADAMFVNAADEPSPLKIDMIRRAPVPVMIVPE